LNKPVKANRIILPVHTGAIALIRRLHYPTAQFLQVQPAVFDHIFMVIAPRLVPKASDLHNRWFNNYSKEALCV
jgi:hypothetical protein